MEADECDCIRCSPQGNGGNVCHHDEQLGHKFDFEQADHFKKNPPPNPFTNCTNAELARILEQGRNLNDLLRAELVKRLSVFPELLG